MFTPRKRSTKIVATLGPATSEYGMIRQLFENGVDVFRLNFSHGEHEEHAQRIRWIRQVEEAYKRPIAIMADLQGPKIRIGRFLDGSISLREGMVLRFDLSPDLGDQTRVHLPHPEFLAALKPQQSLVLSDGRVRLEVLCCGQDFVETEVKGGEFLSDNQGVHAPHVFLPISALTEKDKVDLRFALDLEVDWIALSFVQHPDDVREAKDLIGGRASLLAKIEKEQAVPFLEAITDYADGIMVARGDLGVERPPEDVPSLQKSIVSCARKKGKPCIVATQMLESMIKADIPTRAEASDVATAIYEGADAVMLSAETAVGKFPIDAVRIMDRIAQRTEQDPTYKTLIEAQRPDLEKTPEDALTAAAAQVVKTLSAAVIVTYTTSGSTTLRAARERPSTPILCLTSQLKTARKLALSFGVHAEKIEEISNFSEMVEKAASISHQKGLVKAKQKLIITAGVPFGTPGNTNILHVARIEPVQLTKN